MGRWAAAGVLAAALAAVTGCATELVPEEPTARADDALKTEDHRTIASEFCIRAGFADAFCARVGAEAFVVDSQEWDRPWMHGMPRDGQGHCDAAAEVQQHLTRRGQEIRALLARTSFDRRDIHALAEAVGRALHTLHDNCAHEGMSDPQHAWYSVRGFCNRTGEDPDEQPRALECARNETKLVFRALKEAFRTAGHDPADFGLAGDMAASQPSRAHVCEFVTKWRDFDGVDRRWDIAKTAPAFRSTFTTALLSGAEGPRVCDRLPTGSAGSSPLAIPSPRAQVTARPDPTCLPIRVLCGL